MTEPHAGAPYAGAQATVPAPRAGAADEDFDVWPEDEAPYVRDDAWTGPLRPYASGRRPGIGLVAMLLLGLATAFFAWVSADPFWLSLGGGEHGTITVTDCEGSGVTRRCVGQFVPEGHRVARMKALDDPLMSLSGVAPDQAKPGLVTPARRLSRDARIAYAGDTGGLHLRWMVGAALVGLCAIGMVFATGARKLAGRARVVVTTLSLLSPLLLALAVITVAGF